MEILGLSLTLLGVILAYIWRANGKMQKDMVAMLKDMGTMLKEMGTMLKEISQGQRDMAAMLKEISQGQKEIAQMVLNQTKILEKIEEKISS